MAEIPISLFGEDTVVNRFRAKIASFRKEHFKLDSKSYKAFEALDKEKRNRLRVLLLYIPPIPSPRDAERIIPDSLFYQHLSAYNHDMLTNNLSSIFLDFFKDHEFTTSSSETIDFIDFIPQLEAISVAKSLVENSRGNLNRIVARVPSFTASVVQTGNWKHLCTRKTGDRVDLKTFIMAELSEKFGVEGKLWHRKLSCEYEDWVWEVL